MWFVALIGFAVGVLSGAAYLLLGGEYFFNISRWSRVVFYPGFLVGEHAYYHWHLGVQAAKSIGILAVALAYALMAVVFRSFWLAVKRKHHRESVVRATAILLTLITANSLKAAPPPAKLSTNVTAKIRLVVLPFQNATGDTNWNDWQQALPSLVRSCLDSVGFMEVVRWEKIQPVLKQHFTNIVQPDAAQARQVAQALNANVLVGGRYFRQTNHWIVEALVFNTNSAPTPASIKVVSAGWVDLPELVAKSLAEHLGHPIAEDDLQYWEKYLTGSDTALGCLARAINLQTQDAPASAREKVLRQLLVEDPHCGAAHTWLIQIFGETERTNDLANAIHEFVRQCPDLCDAHLGLSWLLGKGNDREGEKRELLEALRVHRSCQRACEALTTFFGVEERWGDLRKILEPAYAAQPGNSDMAILLAAARAQSGDLKGTGSLLADISDLPGENDTVDIALLVAALRTQQFDLAGGELTRLGPQTVENGFIRETLNSITLRETGQSSNAPILRPRIFTEAELNLELARLLSAEERALVVNPLEMTPAIAAEARRLTVGLTNDAVRSIALFAEVVRRGRGDGDGGVGTAGQSLEKSKDPQARFSCQEYAKLLVALARALHMDAWLVHVDRDAQGSPGYHDCAVVFVNDQGILFDPTWRAIGVLHQSFEVLDDLQAISHQAMQIQGPSDSRRLRLGLKLNPDNRWTQLQFVRGMAHAGEYAAAAEALNQVQKAGGESWDVHEAAAELDMARKYWQPALAELQRALALSPSNALVHVQLATVYGELKDHAQATEQMEAALQCDRGELSQEIRREIPGQIATMKTVVRSTAGDSSARADLQRLAENGDALAQIGLANACFEANPQQVEEGLSWLHKAAEQGDPQTQYDYAKNLNLMRGDAAGEETLKWLTRAAEQGHNEAQYRLGKLLYEGDLAPRDNVAAGQWILLAARSGNAEAKQLLQEMEIFLNAQELTAARKRADDFKPVKSQTILKSQ